MANTFSTIYNKCSVCAGTGQRPTTDAGGNPILVPCSICDATGYIAIERMDVTDLMDKLNDIKEKVDEIKTVVDGL